MQLKSLLLLGASANLALGAALAPRDGGPEKLHFCTELDFGGTCYDEVVELDRCKPIPQTPSTGDKGSSFKFIDVQNPRANLCVLFDKDGCDTGEKGSAYRWVGINSERPYNMNEEAQGDTVFKAYRCQANNLGPMIEDLLGKITTARV